MIWIVDHECDSVDENRNIFAALCQLVVRKCYELLERHRVEKVFDVERGIASFALHSSRHSVQHVVVDVSGEDREWPSGCDVVSLVAGTGWAGDPLHIGPTAGE